MAFSLAGGENPMIFGNTMARPGPLPTAIDNGMARPTGWNENHTSGFVSDQVYTAQYMVRTTIEGWEKHLPVGSHMFAPKLTDSSVIVTDETPRTIMPLHAVNIMLAKFYGLENDPKTAIGMVKDMQRGSQPDHPLADYVDMVPEHAWSSFYDSSDPETRRDPAFVKLHYLTANGIMDRINYLGVQTTEPVRAGELSYAKGEVSAVAVYQGKCDMLNVFFDSNNGDDCFFILKRIRIKDDNGIQKWGPFAFVPYAKPPHLKAIPKSILAYESVTGTMEEGYVIHVGTMLDIQGHHTHADAYYQSWGVKSAQLKYTPQDALAQLKNMAWCQFLRKPTWGQQFIV